MNNDVKLIGHYGSDETHALSAWVSTGGAFLDEIDDKTGKTRRERIPSLLKQLAQAEPNAHETPFEKSMLHFLVTAEQASHIHLIKHRIGVSINGESARYKELTDKYYLPKDWGDYEKACLEVHCEECFRRYHECLNRLIVSGHSRKRAKESARFYLPYASQIQLDISFNWRSFHYFLQLRNEAHAQDEIHSIACNMLTLVRDIDMYKSNEQFGPFHHTIAAFGYDDPKWYIDPLKV